MPNVQQAEVIRKRRFHDTAEEAYDLGTALDVIQTTIKRLQGIGFEVNPEVIDLLEEDYRRFSAEYRRISAMGYVEYAQAEDAEDAAWQLEGFRAFRDMWRC
jgi:hypothetical protein